MLRRKRPGDEPQPQADPRYQGKPMLVLIEDYIRWSIGLLSAERDATLQQTVPKLQQTFRTDAPTWQGCVAHAMELPDTIPAALADLFRTSGAAAAVADGTLDPTTWIQGVADSNFT